MTHHDDLSDDGLVTLTRMPQQLNIVGQHEDWTGVSSPLMRRKQQNRIHQRLYRG